MNKSGILELANNIFDKVSPVNENTYKAELFLGSKNPAGIYFLDFNKKVHSENFAEYQEQLLANEYFNSKGYMQWNYYLLLFQDQFDIKEKQEIERDDRYARKYVFTENDFKNFFKLEKSKHEIDSSVILKWKEKLNEKGLQEVYGKSPVSQAIDRYFTNKSKKNSDVEKYGESSGNVLKINYINKIILTDRYRRFPKEIRTFNFGKVNLIKGINGVGKTSLFESIELILCGKNNRNPDHKNPKGIVKAVFNNSGKIEENQTNSNTIFRNRDAFWYSNNYPTKNYLPSSFNRYNFFNSDAAYSFANSSNEKQIKDALFNLVLGPEYNHIKERIEKFYVYIKPEFNKIKRDIQNNKQIIKEAKEKIETLKTKSTFEKIEASIKSSIKSFKFNDDINNIKENYSEIEVMINRIKSLTEKINEIKNSPKSERELNKEIEAVIIKKKHLKEAIGKYDNLLLKIEDSKLKWKESSNKLPMFIDCNKYFADKRLFEIEGLSDRHKNIDQSIRNILKATEILNGVDSNKYEVEKPILSYLDSHQKKFQELGEKKKDVDEKLMESLNKLGAIEKTVKEIKLLGQKYLTIEQTSTECPLCHSLFEPKELRERIELISMNENAFDAERTKKLHTEQNDLANSIEALKDEISSIQRILKSYFLLFPEENVISAKSSMKEILSIINAELNNLIQLKRTEEQLLETENLIRIHSVSESEFIVLKNKLMQIPISIDFKYNNRGKFKNIETDLRIEIENKISEIESLTTKKFELISNLKRVLEIEIDDKHDINSIKNHVLRDENEKRELKNYFDQLAKIVRLDENDRIDELGLSLNTLSKHIVTLKLELNNQFELNSIHELKKKAEEFVKKNQEKFTRVEAAKSTLELLSGSEGNQEMKSFFSKNIKEIIDIFKTIHIPKEFVDINFEGGLLFLIDIEGKKRKITEISTGQRSALALSIFISLNRKLRNGPDIVIFDDPISFIDDFNALSFLDFLRYFVLKENKQIFFATASTKLANLFERKFSFLENDFKKWELKRDII